MLRSRDYVAWIFRVMATVKLSKPVIQSLRSSCTAIDFPLQALGIS